MHHRIEINDLQSQAILVIVKFSGPLSGNVDPEAMDRLEDILI